MDRHRPLLLLGFAVLAVAFLLSLVPDAAPVRAAADDYDIAVIPVEGTIDRVLESTLSRRMEVARAAEPDAIVVVIDSWGGQVDAATDIADHIFEQRSPDGPRIVALGETKVISAGALLALACEEIYLRPNVIIGDVAPVVPSSEGGMRILGEKEQSAIRRLLATYAERNGYPVALVEAMVSPSWTVWRLVGEDGSVEIVSGEELDGWSDERTAGIAEREQIDGPETLVTLSPDEAKEYGLVREVVRDRDALWTLLAGEREPVVRVLELSWWERLVTWLNSPLVRMILLGLGVLGAWIEIKAPGFGVPGVTSILAFGLFFFGGYLAGLTDVIEVVLFGVGVGLILVEILSPGFAIFGISGIACVLASFVLSQQTFLVPADRGELVTLSINLLVTFGGMTAAIVAMFGLMRVLPESRLFSRLVHRGRLADAVVRESDPAGSHRDLVGSRGTAVTDLRPSGRIQVEGRPVDAMAEGTFIESDTRIRVTGVDGAQVVVRPEAEASDGVPEDA